MSHSKFLRNIFGWMSSAFLIFAAPSHGAVITYIDLLDSTQIVSTNNATVSNTISSPNSLGNYRTLRLTTAGGSAFFGPTVLGVDGSAQQLLLNTPGSANPSFEVKWGGAGGTAGLGGIDLTAGAGNFSLTETVLTFDLNYADQTSPFSWTFIDTSSNVATYAGSLSPVVPPNPAIPYAITLSSFSGAGTIDWTSINFITLTGGGIVGLDLALSGPITITAVPEPGTWAAAGLLLLAAIYIRWRRSRSIAAEEAPAAA